MNEQEFANKIRAKYPGAYDNVSDTDLTNKVIAKYPVYANQVKTIASPGKDLNYIQRVSKGFSEAGKNIVSEVKRGSEAIQNIQSDGKIASVPEVLGGAGKLLETGLRTAGQIAISAFTPITEAPIIKPLIEGAVEKVSSYPLVQDLISGASEIAKKYPEAAKDIEAIVNIASLGTGKAVSAPLKTEAKAIGKDIVAGTKSLLTPTEEVVQSKIQSLFEKSIKPTAKKTLAQGEKYQNDTLNALKTIKNNADSLNIIDNTGEIITGRTPQTINELAQAIDQTKTNVFTQYDNLAKQAGKAGAFIDAKPLAAEVAKVAQNRALQITNPEIITYAENWAKRLQGLDVLDTETTQAVIQNLNNNLQSFYKNPTYESASKVAIDAGVANNFRKALDTAIEGATGQEYQTLKNQYGALKAIENDVVRASMRDARKNVKGLIDYTDIFTSGQMVAGALSLNPAMFTKGAVERGFKEYIKFVNDPNRAIKNIFTQLDRTTSSKEFVPQSATGKFIKNPKLGLSVEDISQGGKIAPENLPTTKNINSSLIQEAKKYKTAEEFVKAQPTVFRAGSIDTNNPAGVFLSKDKKTASFYESLNNIKTNDYIIDPNAKIRTASTREELLKEIDQKFNELNFLEKFYKEERAIMKKDGKGLINGMTPRQRYETSIEQRIADKLKGKYDGILYESGGKNDQIGEYQIFNKSVIKTKSQLTDIWKKANKK